MKVLYIVRHAKSSWEDASLADHQRPLNTRGLKNVPEMGKRLKRKRVNPDLIVSSPAVRALATAQIIALELGYPETEIEENTVLFHASEKAIFNTIKVTDDHVDTLMLVGHNPGLTYFCNDICKTYRIENLPTCGVFAVRFKVISWKEINADNCELIFFDFPKNTENR